MTVSVFAEQHSVNFAKEQYYSLNRVKVLPYLKSNIAPYELNDSCPSILNTRLINSIIRPY